MHLENHKLNHHYFSDEDYIILEGEPSPETLKRITDFICWTLELRPGHRVLDAGCGTGIIASALAERDYVVTAIDSSDFMVSRCGAFASRTANLTCLKQDYHTMSYHNQFDAVVSWNHSLGYTTREDDRNALERMYKALAPGGKLLLDLHNLSAYLKYFIGRHWEERETAFALRDAEYDFSERKFICRGIVAPKGSEPTREQTLTFLEYEPDEIASVLQDIGFADVTFFGDDCPQDCGRMFCPEGYSEESTAMVIRAVKK